MELASVSKSMQKYQKNKLEYFQENSDLQVFKNIHADISQEK